MVTKVIEEYELEGKLIHIEAVNSWNINKTYVAYFEKEDGTLGIYEEDTNNEVPNYSNPSKKQILLQAVKDLNGDVDSNITFYQLQHKLEKFLLK